MTRVFFDHAATASSSMKIQKKKNRRCQKPQKPSGSCVHRFLFFYDEPKITANRNSRDADDDDNDVNDICHAREHERAYSGTSNCIRKIYVATFAFEFFVSTPSPPPQLSFAPSSYVPFTLPLSISFFVF